MRIGELASRAGVGQQTLRYKQTSRTLEGIPVRELGL